MDASHLRSQLEALIAQRRKMPAGAMYTVAAIPAMNGGWFTVSARCSFEEERREPRTPQRYRNLLLTERWFDAGALVDSIVEVVRNGFDDEAGHVSGGFDAYAPPQWSTRGAPGVNYSAGPEWTFTASRTGGPGGGNPTSDPVVARGLPPYPSGALAVVDWIWGAERAAGFGGGPIPHQGEVAFIIPDVRARLPVVSWERDDLTIWTSFTTEPASLEVQCVAVVGHERRVILTATPRSEPFRVKLPEGTDTVEVYLIHEDQLVDKETLYGPNSAASYGDDYHKKQAEKDTRERGESEEVEFKPFMRKGGDKQQEVIDTVVAFSNTVGGRLYFGITDAGEPEGRAAMLRAAKCSEDEALGNLIAEMRELIRNHVQPTPHVEPTWFEIDGSPVILFNVPRGASRPYKNQKNDVLVRKGATNRKADPHSELPALYAPQPLFVNSEPFDS